MARTDRSIGDDRTELDMVPDDVALVGARGTALFRVTASPFRRWDLSHEFS
jgi:hypothetical protein